MKPREKMDLGPSIRAMLDTCHKGMWIKTPEIEILTGTRSSDAAAFGLSVLWLRELIEHEKGILSRVECGNLRLMTDSEASEWNVRRVNHHEDGLNRCNKRLALIDTSGMDANQRAQHEASSRYVSTIASAARKAREEQRKFAAIFGLPTDSADD